MLYRSTPAARAHSRAHQEGKLFVQYPPLNRLRQITAGLGWRTLAVAAVVAAFWTFSETTYVDGVAAPAHAAVEKPADPGSDVVIPRLAPPRPPRAAAAQKPTPRVADTPAAGATNVPAPIAAQRSARPGGEPAPTPSASPRRFAPPVPLPGEFEHQSALLIGCGDMVLHAPEIFCDIVRAAHQTIPVLAICATRAQARRGTELLAEHGLPDAAGFLVLPVNTVWVRDYGPIFVRHADGSVSAVDVSYSPPEHVEHVRAADEDAPRLLGRSLGLPVVKVPLDLEGGNFLTNGEGLAVTSTTMLGHNLHRGYENRDIARLLNDKLGVTYGWIYVEPLEGEGTGHVDMFMTFLARDLAVVGKMDPRVDPNNAAILDKAAGMLAKVRLADGTPMRVERVPMPARRKDGFWRTYTNVIFANGTLLMPTFSDVDPQLQQEAFATFARLLPGWKIAGIRADELVAKQGLLHCISLHLPSYVSPHDFRPLGERSLDRGHRAASRR